MKKNLLGVSTLALLACAGAAWAQTAETTTSEIIVTGTRQTGIKAADSAQPIELIGSAALMRSGSPDLMNALAATVPSLNIEAFGSDTAQLTISAALRGLSPNDTLVLIDGKRRHTTANLSVDSGSPYSGAATTDLSWIPVESIDHIEVLTDGAAAQYGSDAVAGVVNVILKKSDHGGELTTQGGQYYEGDGNTGAGAINKGFKFLDHGFFNVTLEERYHDFSQQGGPDSRYFNPDGSLVSGVSAANAAGLAEAPGTPRVNKIYGDPQFNLYNLFVNGGYDFGAFQLYGFGNIGYREISAYENYRQATKVEGTTSTGILVLPSPAGFQPREKLDEVDYSFTGGAKGDVSGYGWDLAVTYGSDFDKGHTIDTLNQSLFPILQAQSATPIVAQRNFFTGTYQNSEFDTTLNVDKSYNVGLADPLNVAGGFEYRRDMFTIGAGEPSSYYGDGASSNPGFQPFDAGTNSRSNYAGYIDVAGKPITALQIDVAGRYEHYSDFGDTEIGKVTARYDFSPAIALRGTFSTGFRAPTLQEEYYSGTNVGPTSAFVQLPADSPQAASAGIPALKPEISHNYSAGLVFHPASRLQITADIYDIVLHDRIVGSGSVVGLEGTYPNQTVVSQNVLNAIKARGITLDTQSLTYAGINLFVNGANTRTQGAEITANYASDFGEFGHVDWSLGFNYNDTKITKEGDLPSALQNVAQGQIAIFTAAAASALVDSTPKEKVVLSGFWTKGPWGVNLTQFIYGESSQIYTRDGTINTNLTIPITPITNLDISYKVTKSLKLSVGAINLFDTKPPSVPNYYNGTQEKPIDNGNVYSAPLTFSPFGINGGYYYGRATLSF